MTASQLNIPSPVQEAFISFISNASVLALPLHLDSNTLEDLAPIHRDVQSSFQESLSLLDNLLDSKASTYLLLRRSDTIYAITFVPYQAPENETKLYLRFRHDLVKSLGEKHIDVSLICKEVGEITDARSWIERDAYQQEDGAGEHADGCEDLHEQDEAVKDAGYRKNKCRLCDRRMKNKITSEALAALDELGNEGDCVQISLDADLVLKLDLQRSPLSPESVSSHLPTTQPTYTFYRHPNGLLYFIFHSPDSATVQQRMKHTMAIPGLVNVHAEARGVHVDQKVEIHEPEDLDFQEKDERVGRFRSVYLRGKWHGTESQYEALERDKAFQEALR